MKISFVCILMKTNFDNKNYAHTGNLAFINIRFKATQNGLFYLVQGTRRIKLLCFMYLNQLKLTTGCDSIVGLAEHI